MRVLVVDQQAVSSYWLHQHPMTLDALIADLRTTDRWLGYHAPEVREVEDSYQPAFGTIALCAATDGIAIIWKSNVDSSG